MQDAATLYSILVTAALAAALLVGVGFLYGVIVLSGTDVMIILTTRDPDDYFGISDEGNIITMPLWTFGAAVLMASLLTSSIIAVSALCIRLFYAG